MTDVHGSDLCFRKFLNAGKFYNVGVLILGGDITGKLIVPMIQKPDGAWEASFLGKQMSMKTKGEMEEMRKTIRDSGAYPYETTEDEYQRLSADPKLVTELFARLMKEGIARWLSLAEERLKGTGIQCFISPGNDDIFELDEVLNSSPYAVNPEEKVVAIGSGHEMLTLGYANHTPWNSPREVDERVLAEKIQSMVSQVKDMKRAVFNFHVPPIDTVMDQAPKLDADFKPVLSGGHLMMISAGSSAVREAITKHQPLVGLHGHIHESRGTQKLGKTLCLNPGSEYNTGILRGALCELDGDRIRSHVLTSG